MKFVNVFRPFQHEKSQPGNVETALHEDMELAVINLPPGDVEIGQEAIMVDYGGRQTLDVQHVIPIPAAAPCGPANLPLICADHVMTDLTGRYSDPPTGLPISVLPVHNASAVETACMCCTDSPVSVLSAHHALAAKTAYAYTHYKPHVHGTGKFTDVALSATSPPIGSEMLAGKTQCMP
jgi:hypothetical protein